VNVVPNGVTKICLHKNLIACVELDRTLSRKVNTDAFLFKATKENITAMN
jgi:hypothetical protein